MGDFSRAVYAPGLWRWRGYHWREHDRDWFESLGVRNGILNLFPKQFSVLSLQHPGGGFPVFWGVSLDYFDKVRHP